MSPAICFICENSPTQSAERVIDTTREFNPECLTRLSGRKYICEGCATEMGQAMGQVSVAEYEALVQTLEDSVAQNAELRSELDEARTQQARVVDPDAVMASIGPVFQVISDRLEKLETKPAAKPKPVVRPTE